MELVGEEEFNAIAGKMMSPRRNMDTFNGDDFLCACGSHHKFQKDYIYVVSEGFNGKFVFMCPSNENLISVIQTKMKWGIFYQGLEYLAGTEV